MFIVKHNELTKKPKYTIKSRIWITDGESTFLGEGRIFLLKEIEKHGSISKAAKAMKMSYKKALQLVSAINDQAPELLVTPKIGGVGGGGSELSEAGKRAIEVFSEINEANREYLDVKLNEMNL